MHVLYVPLMALPGHTQEPSVHTRAWFQGTGEIGICLVSCNVRVHYLVHACTILTHHSLRIVQQPREQCYKGTRDMALKSLLAPPLQGAVDV